MGNKETNKQRFDILHTYKNEIESEFGEPLRWQRLDNKRASRIGYFVEKGLNQKEQWQEIQDDMVEKMMILEKIMRKYINNL